MGTKHSPRELSYAAQMSLRYFGSVDAAKVKDISMTSPTCATKYRIVFKSFPTQMRKLSNSEFFSLFIDANLTREQYNKVKRKDLARFSPYKVIQQAEKSCYPEPTANTVDETSTKVKQKALLDHTA
ncbi:hypothetical protein EVAR_30897_1 [Eumeta japonica]|uniref:Uncharacterized protein n=1 Tax=Eumeta variegata TaxID=151549 RepID=A0A4C1V414_EUMVA|nr:hypothetical protein EVAR_30897_1 [Eumeta japonica]